MHGVNQRAGAFDKCMAALLTVAIACYWVPATMAATQPQLAEIRGNVTAADGLTAIAGVSVKAANMQTRQIYSSAPTGENGAYTLAGLPAGSYDLAVETHQGLFAADLLVDAGAGRRTIVSLALKPGAQEQGQEGQQGEKPKEEPPKTEEGKKDEGTKEEKPKQPEPQQEKKKKKGTSFWRSPGGAAIAIVVGAALVGAAANGATGNNNSDEPPMSPH